jgi:hypothetical protein
VPSRNRTPVVQVAWDAGSVVWQPHIQRLHAHFLCLADEFRKRAWPLLRVAAQGVRCDEVGQEAEGAASLVSSWPKFTECTSTLFE